MNGRLLILSMIIFFVGCSSTKPTIPDENRNAALEHFLQGSILDQKGDYAKAILEYQDALKYMKDPAIYYAIAKDYAILGKHDLAIQMGSEAVTLNPKNRIYQQTLAEIYLNALDLENAMKEYEKVIKLDPQHREGWHTLARLHMMRNPAKAIEIFKEIVDRFGPDEDAYYQMAQIYSSTGKYDKATEALRQMLLLDPGNFEIAKALGDIYLRQDSVDAAITIYNELTERRPENLELRAAIAHAYLIKQDYESATEQLEYVMKKDTLSADELIRFGQIFVSFIQKDSAVAPLAIHLFEKIKSNYPADWRPFWFLGAINNIMRNDSIALINYFKVIELAKWNADGWTGVASIYYDRNQFEDAINILNEGKKFISEEFRIYFLLGISYQRLHKPTDAASVLEKALQLNEKSIDAMSALGLVYDELKRFEDSDSIYERALQLDPRNHLLLNNYGYSLCERGLQLERAMKMSKEALAQQPENQSYLDTYGWIYYQLGDYKEAERWVRKAVELGSKSTVIHDHLGDIYFKLSEKSKALEYWQKALDLDPNNQSLKEKIQRGSP
ncbi:MAG: tetratricopeptide repeat protein [Bacteroidota bacterium]|nr:tetratricopeptide repeat protein [Bacteroidota bacterium]